MTGDGHMQARGAAFADPERSLVATLRRRRRLQQGLLTAVYVLVSVFVTVALSFVKGGPRVSAAVVAPTLGAVAGGMLAFTGVVFSLLLLVVQFGSTTFTPRLNLFRNDPFVWHSFAFFVATITYCSIAALDLSNQADVSTLIPIVAVLAALVALALFRSLQMRALQSIQLAPAVESVASRGWQVLDRYYHEPFEERPTTVAQTSGDGIEVLWRGAPRVVQQIELAGLVGWSESHEAVVEVLSAIGSVVTAGDVVARVCGVAVDADGVLSFVHVGLERTFDQDPLFAFRLLSDIAVRALSPAVNDPATAIEVLSATQGLLRRVVGARLDLSFVHAADGQVRLVLALPKWPDFLAEALDETALAARTQPTVLQRLALILDDLHARAPADRQAAVRLRQDWVADQLSAAGPLPGGPQGQRG